MKKTQCKCGSKEFVTQPNTYDVYELIEGEMCFMSNELTNEEECYYCRDCGEQFNDD